MPLIQLSHVVSVSSEDKNYPAENLLKQEKYDKWKCAGNQSQITVILQLEKSSRISSIDIGNEGSAFVEVLVGKMTDNDSNYKVLLVASSFMSPMESRSGENSNRVRMFTEDKLCAETLSESWDRLKIVCSQPYNKSIQYGLSFIKIHSSAECQEVKRQNSFGNFILKDEETDEPDLIPGSLFAQRKNTNLRPSGALEVRQSSAKEENELITKPNLLITPKIKIETKSNVNKRQNTSSNQQSTPKRPKNTEPSEKHQNKSDVTVEFNELMKGVVFALSGFVNPNRAQIRDKAVDMGAKYKTDWNQSCTHLICAFRNTPKFNQVKAENGKIVSKEWIFDCHKLKTRLPWTKYNMRTDEPVVKDTTDRSMVNKQKQKDKDNDNDDDDDEKKVTSSEDEYGGSTDVDEEEVRNNYDSDTDVEEEVAASEVRGSLPELPDYFRGQMFFFYGEFDEVERRLLTRYITAFNGRLSQYMSQKVDYVITNSSWDEHFDDALELNKNLAFVKSQWIMNCAKKEKWLPYQPYTVTS
ncbi:X-ray repair complementing defective repair in Chinese hamster cells 1 [Chamberlinius hualienensis]